MKENPYLVKTLALLHEQLVDPTTPPKAMPAILDAIECINSWHNKPTDYDRKVWAEKKVILLTEQLQKDISVIPNWSSIGSTNYYGLPKDPIVMLHLRQMLANMLLED